MSGIDCISKGYKELLASFITRDVAKAVVLEVLENMPICEPMPSTLSAEGQKAVQATRKKSEEWGIEVDYTDENGLTTKFPSPSNLTKFLNLKMSGQQASVCDGEKCKALDVVDIIRLGGFTVECETEETQKAGPEVITLDCLKASAGGKSMHVYHPAILEVPATVKTAKAKKK
jgi:hypothetical protein